jgi:hypothetical protein
MKLVQGHILKNKAIPARILLASIMLLAIVFKSLPDSVFDYFHNHEHALNEPNDHPSIGNYKHNCHIEDWNFETFEVTEHQYQSNQLSATSSYIVAPFELCQNTPLSGIGRAPPVVLTF